MEYDDSITSTLPAGSEGFIVAFAVIAVIAAFITYLLNAIFLQQVFKKANFEPSWGPWVPFYNTYLLLKFGGQNSIWFWLYLIGSVIAAIPIVGSILSFVISIVFAIVTVYAYININKSFGKEENLVMWTIFAVLFPLIWAAVIAFSSCKYRNISGPVFAPNFGPGNNVKTI